MAVFELMWKLGQLSFDHDETLLAVDLLLQLFALADDEELPKHFLSSINRSFHIFQEKSAKDSSEIWTLIG